MNIFTIDNKIDVSWHPEVVAVLESWTDYDLDLESFRRAVFVKGINHAKASQAKAWILDPGQATGSVSDEIQAMIDQDRFPALAWTGVRYFVTLNPAASDTTVNPDTSNTRGVQCVETPTLETAFAWLKAQNNPPAGI